MIARKPRRKLVALVLTVLVFGGYSAASAAIPPPECVLDGTCLVTGEEWGEVWSRLDYDKVTIRTPGGDLCDVLVRVGPPAHGAQRYACQVRVP